MMLNFYILILAYSIFRSIRGLYRVVSTFNSEMDIVFSTRYHGLVFALISDVPAIAINYDLYYRTKNDSAFIMAGKVINRLEYQSFSAQEGIELVKKTINLHDKTC